MFPAIPHQTISVEDSLVGLVSFVCVITKANHNNQYVTETIEN